ncbi:MAG: PilN domain-containing protein [Acetobacteraceae bacterium]
MNAWLERATARCAAWVRAGLAWWLAELLAMVPARLRRDPDRARITLEASDRGMVLVVNSRGADPPVRLPLTDDDADGLRKRIRSLTRDASTDRLVIRFDHSLLLDTEITLPAAAERVMRPILLNQLERLVPLPASDIVFHHAVAPHAAGGPTRRVHLTIATRASIEQALERARAFGFQPRRVVAPNEAAWSGGTVVLWRADGSTGVPPLQRRLRRGLEAATLAFLVLAYGAYLHRLDSQLEDLSETVRQRTRLAAAARELGKEQQRTQGIVTMLQQRQRELTALQLLDEVTRLVPPNSWISQLSVRGRQVEMVGFSPRVADIVTGIENHDIFWDPRFLSPITQSPDGKGQRFNLSFQIWLEGDT